MTEQQMDQAPVFLDDPVVDRLARVCLELAGELWATRQRLALVEDQLVEQGVVTDPDLQIPSPDTQEQRDAFVERVVGPLIP